MTDVFEFTLAFKLPDTAGEPESYLDALHGVGCSDATVGIGKPRIIALDFDREAESLEAAIESATDNVVAAIPGAVSVTA